MNRQKQEALAEKIKKRQGLLGWNRKEMARRASVSLSVLGNALDGQSVSDEKMRQICEAVGVEFDSVPEAKAEKVMIGGEEFQPITVRQYKKSKTGTKAEGGGQEMPRVTVTRDGIKTETEGARIEQKGFDVTAKTLTVEQPQVEQQTNEIVELRAQIEQLQKALCATATERDDAVKELCKERRKREEAEKAAERAANAAKGANAQAEEARRELRDLKASLFDDMREELRRTKEELARLEENAI